MLSSTQFHEGAQVTIGYSEIAKEFLCLSYHRSEKFDIGAWENRATFTTLAQKAKEELQQHNPKALGPLAI